MITLVTRILYRAIPLLWFYVLSKVRFSHCLIAATFFMVGSLANSGDLNYDGVVKRYDNCKTSFVNFWKDLNGVKESGQGSDDNHKLEQEQDAEQPKLIEEQNLQENTVEITGVDYSPFE